MLQPRRSLVAMLGMLAACASGPEIRKLGDYGSVNPLFTTPQNQKTPSEMTVSLTQPSYVAALFVVPGRGAVIVYPTDTLASTRLDAGQHTIPVHFAEMPQNRDSLLAAIRRQGMGTRGNPPRVRPDTFHRDTTRVRGDSSNRGFGGLREAGPGASPIGYLLLVASSREIPLNTLERRINGITIPIDDDEALSTVMKLVKSAIPDGANLAGYAKELDRS